MVEWGHMFLSDRVSGLADSPPLLRMYRWYLDLGSPEDRFVLHIRTDHGRESVDGRMMVPATLIGPLPCLRCPSAPSPGKWNINNSHQPYHQHQHLLHFLSSHSLSSLAVSTHTILSAALFTHLTSSTTCATQR